MKNLKAKLRRDGGFTLVEMLIVVAIIAILIAISIPMVGSALERAGEATDAANERAFRGALTSAYLLGTAGMDNGTTVVAKTTYAYDAVNGVVTDKAVAKGYGKSDTSGDSSVVCKDKVLYGKIAEDGTVTIGWDAKNTTPAGVTPDGNLVSTDLAGKNS